MSVKSFKFVSPGVFINEIDNSFIPRAANAIGPVVIGRATRGLAMTPVKVESYSQFVEMFGNTVPGNGGGDIYRHGNYQSPMYGTYAAKAFLNANVAPLTFIRLLGTQHTDATSGYAGWKTTNSYNAGAGPAGLKASGGAYGLWVFQSSSFVEAASILSTGSLAAVIYADSGSVPMLSGAVAVGAGGESRTNALGVGVVVANDSTTKNFILAVSSSTNGLEKVNFNFDDSSENFIRKVVSTNPQLASAAGTYYPSTSYKDYWLGESYEQVVRDGVEAAAAGSTTLGGSGTGGSGTGDSALTASTVQLVAHDTTVFRFHFTDDSVSRDAVPGNTNNINATGSAATLLSRLERRIEEIAGARGAGKILVSNGALTAGTSGSFTVTQNKPGEAGNTTVTLTNNDASLTFTGDNLTGGAPAAATGLVGGGNSLVGADAYAVILPIAKSSDTTVGPFNMHQQSSVEARAGWFVGQHLGRPASFVPEELQKLFRLKGRGHGAWLHNNVKVSIEKIRRSTTTISDYGTFSVVLRSLNDTDNKVLVLERYDNLTLDPASPNYIARKIGDKYVEWDSINGVLKTYGEYDNKSKFVYVEMNDTVDAGGTDPLLLPFGYYGPPKFTDVKEWNGRRDNGDEFIFAVTGSYLSRGKNGAIFASGDTNSMSGSANALTGTLSFPMARLRHSASDGGLANQTNAYFGMQTTRSPSSTRPDASVGGLHRLLYSGFPDDPVGSTIAGVDSYSYVFTLDDVRKSAANVYYYHSGSRVLGSSATSGSYNDLLKAGYDRFTAPFWGGFDGFDIKRPDPLANSLMTDGTSNELNSYVYNTYKQAIDTVSDPEAIDMNLLLAPGLTFDSLTGHMIDVCEERADALALIDLKDVYIPPHEAYHSSKKDRIGTTPTNAANDLRDRRLDSSYGCTFYPWVQTRDDQTGRNLWIPPTVAMAGVLASSQAKSDVWFAPAGFNRGGLSDGAAGIPVTGITERLTSKDRDTLYEARINPIASFPSSGIVVFGQKTLQERQSALDRINVRRLVIYLKKQISILSTQVLFEQNVQSTWNRFKSLIEPFLANVKVEFGITDYKLILDESTTTPDLIDQNILYAKIMVKPARAIEYIAIDFVIASTGASFDD